MKPIHAISDYITNMAATVTSREIAEVTGKQHDKVCRDILAMITQFSEEPDLRWHCESETYMNAHGKPREQYRLDRATAITLVSGYLRHMIETASNRSTETLQHTKARQWGEQFEAKRKTMKKLSPESINFLEHTASAKGIDPNVMIRTAYATDWLYDSVPFEIDHDYIIRDIGSLLNQAQIDHMMGLLEASNHVVFIDCGYDPDTSSRVYFSCALSDMDDDDWKECSGRKAYLFRLKSDKVEALPLLT